MSSLNVNIEQLVQEVMARLTGRPPAEQAEAVKSASPPEIISENRQRSGSSDVLQLAVPVVTLKEVSGRLESIRRLVVLPHTVITPAVRDELYRRGIILERTAQVNGQAAKVRLILGVVGREFNVEAILDSLQQADFQAERLSAESLPETVEQLAARLAQPQTLGVLFTSRPAAALCLANRLRGVRAIGTQSAVAQAAAEVGANLLVLDIGAGFFSIRQAVLTFARGGVRPCPTEFIDKLS